MDRSNYPDRMEVRSTDLAFTESSKIREILERTRAWTRAGVVDGLEVTASTALGAFDIQSGYGYTPSGERVDLTAAVATQLVGLIDMPVLVGLMYRERVELAGVSIFGNLIARRTRGSSELMQVSVDAFDALPASAGDLTVDAQDRFLICAVVRRANSGALTIQVPPPRAPSRAATQPVGIPAVRLVAVDPDAPLSDPAPRAGAFDPATVIFDGVTLAVAYRAPRDETALGQAAPFDAPGVGVAVSVSAGGTFRLTSGDGLTFVDIEVDAQRLPRDGVSGIPVTSTFTVTAAPGESEGPERAHPTDLAHRSARGTGLVTAQNIHGLSLADLAGALFNRVLGGLNLGELLAAAGSLAENPALQFATSGLALGEYQHLAEVPGTAAMPAFRLYRRSDALVLSHNCRWSNTLGLWERRLDYGDDPTKDAWVIEWATGFVAIWTRSLADSNSWSLGDMTRLFYFQTTDGYAEFLGNLVTPSTLIANGGLVTSGNISAGGDLTLSGDVIGNLTLTGDWLYNAPVTYTEAFFGGEFRGFGSNLQTQLGGSLLVSGTQPWVLVLPIHLLTGDVLQQITVTYGLTGASAVTLRLISQSPIDPAVITVLGQWELGQLIGLETVTVSISPSSETTVNNADRVYYLYILNQTILGQVQPNAALELVGGAITAQVTKRADRRGTIS